MTLAEEKPAAPAPDPVTYVKDRVLQYQGWYDKKSTICKKRYLGMRSLAVIGGAIVPVLINVDVEGITWVTTLISLLVVVVVSLESVLHYREQWKNYRSTEQYLGHEVVYFENRAGAYRELDDGAAFMLLVDRVESAIAAENASTLNTMTLAQQVTEEQGKGGA